MNDRCLRGPSRSSRWRNKCRCWRSCQLTKDGILAGTWKSFSSGCKKYWTTGQIFTAPPWVTVNTVRLQNLFLPPQTALIAWKLEKAEHVLKKSPKKTKYRLSPHLANSTLLNRTTGDPVHGHPCCSPSARISQRPFCLLQGSNVTIASEWQVPDWGPGRPLSCTPWTHLSGRHGWQRGPARTGRS